MKLAAAKLKWQMPPSAPSDWIGWRSSFGAVRRAARGFTLVEMILAIGVAAIVLIAVNAVLFTALHLRNETTRAVDAATPIDTAMTFLRRDLACIVPPTNGTTKVLSGCFRVGNINSEGISVPVAIEMYTADGALSQNAPWADIQRVTYELKNSVSTPGQQDLYRSVVRNLLATSTPQVQNQLLLPDVDSFKVSCYDGSQWLANWDTSDPSSANTNLPLAVRVDIGLAGSDPNEPIELIVPIDCVAPTNVVLTSNSSSGS